MAQINQLSLSIPDADLTEIRNCVNTLHTKLLPYLKTLSPEERHELPKMGDKTVSFVQKTVEYCQQNPDLVPPFLNVGELAIDVTTVETIRALYEPLLQITDSLSDTMTLAGSEAYSAALMFYNSAKHAMKSKVQKAETIYNDLSVRFPGRPRAESAAAKEA